MGDKSAIEWTDATWNPLVGCSKVSPGCDMCYAIGVVHRAMQPAHVGLTVKPDGAKPDWTGEIRQLPDRLDQPLRWKRPRRIFLNSLSDLYHPDVPLEFIGRVYDVMAKADWHTFQILTKRPQRAAQIHPGLLYPTERGGWAPLPNVWFGASIENDRYSFRANHVRATAAAIRFLSLEPLLGPLPSLDLTEIDWVIVGGESGPGARPMHPDWVRDLRDRCCDAGVAFHFKQWGAWAPFNGELPLHLGNRYQIMVPTGHALNDRAVYMRRDGKKANGRVLDGRTWDEWPKTA